MENKMKNANFFYSKKEILSKITLGMLIISFTLPPLFALVNR
jgi:hypothetical protein